MLYILQVMLMITPLYCRKQCDLETTLRKASVKLFKWFDDNSMKANQDKCHFLLPRLDINTKFSLPACMLEN